MNNKQKLASAISGWDPIDSGAKCDYYYYNCTSVGDQIQHLAEYACNVLGITDMTCAHYDDVRKYLQQDFATNNEAVHAFNAL